MATASCAAGIRPRPGEAGIAAKTRRHEEGRTTRRRSRERSEARSTHRTARVGELRAEDTVTGRAVARPDRIESRRRAKPASPALIRPKGGCSAGLLLLMRRPRAAVVRSSSCLRVLAASWSGRQLFTYPGGSPRRCHPGPGRCEATALCCSFFLFSLSKSPRRPSRRRRHRSLASTSPQRAALRVVVS